MEICTRYCLIFFADASSRSIHICLCDRLPVPDVFHSFAHPSPRLNQFGALLLHLLINFYTIYSLPVSSTRIPAKSSPFSVADTLDESRDPNADSSSASARRNNSYSRAASNFEISESSRLISRKRPCTRPKSKFGNLTVVQEHEASLRQLLGQPRDARNGVISAGDRVLA
jgi:hypothetical protein